MAVKMIADTWKVNKRQRREREHMFRYRRMNQSGRLTHLIDCASCLAAALKRMKETR